MKLDSLIGKCSEYDLKLMLEKKKPKSRLKSVSGLGDSLFFGIYNDGVRGLNDVQHICEVINSKISDNMEKRGSGLTHICNDTKTLNEYRDELKPVFESTPTLFQTNICAFTDTPNDRDVVGGSTI